MLQQEGLADTAGEYPEGNVEPELICFKFTYMKLCLEMHFFPEVTLMDSMAAVPGVPETQAGQEGQQRVFLMVLLSPVLGIAV